MRLIEQVVWWDTGDLCVEIGRSGNHFPCSFFEDQLFRGCKPSPRCSGIIQPETVMLKPHIDLALRRMVAMKVPKAPLLKSLHCYPCLGKITANVLFKKLPSIMNSNSDFAFPCGLEDKSQSRVITKTCSNGMSHKKTLIPQRYSIVVYCKMVWNIFFTYITLFGD